MAARNLPGPYRIEHFRAETWTVATNKPPLGVYRGVARPGACFAIERTIDEVARAVGRDPLEVRIDNMVGPDEMPYRTVCDMKFDNGDYPEAVRRAAALIDYDGVRARQASPLAGRAPARRRARQLHRTIRPRRRGMGAPPHPHRRGLRDRDRAHARRRHAARCWWRSTATARGWKRRWPRSPARSSASIPTTSRSASATPRSRPSAWGPSPRARSSWAAARCPTPASRCATRWRRIAAHHLQCDAAGIPLRRRRGGGAVGLDRRFAEIGRIAHLRQEQLPDGMDPGPRRDRDLGADRILGRLFLLDPRRRGRGRSRRPARSRSSTTRWSRTAAPWSTR